MHRKGQSKSATRRVKPLLFAAVATGAVFLGLLLWAGGVFKVKTKDGTIVLENLPPDADVTVDGGTVSVTSSDGNTFEVRVDATKKKHRVGVKQEGFKVFGEEVVVDAGGRKSVLVRLEPKENPAEGVPKKIPVEKELPKTATVDVGGGVKMEFVRIPAGKFLMGSPEDENPRRGDEKQHEVEITRAFYLGKYLVTQQQYEQVMGSNPSEFSATGRRQGLVAGQDTPLFPVDSVSWEDAVAFCRKLSDRPEEKRAGFWLYRLPTEAEWEYACRGGAAAYSVFHYGNSLSSAQANFNGNWPYGGAARGPHLQKTTKVGSYQPNAFGLYDMHGNVFEWCADWYGTDYYESSPRQDPPGPYGGSHRVSRGGGWNDNAFCSRAAAGTPGASPMGPGRLAAALVIIRSVPIGKKPIQTHCQRSPGRPAKPVTALSSLARRANYREWNTE